MKRSLAMGLAASLAFAPLHDAHGQTARQAQDRCSQPLEALLTLGPGQGLLSFGSVQPSSGAVIEFGYRSRQASRQLSTTYRTSEAGPFGLRVTANLQVRQMQIEGREEACERFGVVSFSRPILSFGRYDLTMGAHFGAIDRVASTRQVDDGLHRHYFASLLPTRNSGFEADLSATSGRTRSLSIVYGDVSGLRMEAFEFRIDHGRQFGLSALLSKTPLR